MVYFEWPFLSAPKTGEYYNKRGEHLETLDFNAHGDKKKKPPHLSRPPPPPPSPEKSLPNPRINLLYWKMCARILPPKPSPLSFHLSFPTGVQAKSEGMTIWERRRRSRKKKRSKFSKVDLASPSLPLSQNALLLAHTPAWISYREIH